MRLLARFSCKIFPHANSLRIVRAAEYRALSACCDSFLALDFLKGVRFSTLKILSHWSSNSSPKFLKRLKANSLLFNHAVVENYRTLRKP